MLSDHKGKKLQKYVPYYVVFDFETTGISCNYDEVIEVSAVKVENGKVVDEFSTLVNPQKPIPMQASLVNGITNGMVANSPTIEQVLPEFLRFLGDNVLVGHNIHSFDMKFLYRYADQYYGKTIDNDYIDTLTLARGILPQLSHHKLGDVAAHYGISTAGAHRALADCHMNQKVYEKLGQDLQQAKEQGGANALRQCPCCNSLLQKRKGRFGEFWGCSNYPRCRYTENV